MKLVLHGSAPIQFPCLIFEVHKKWAGDPAIWVEKYEEQDKVNTADSAFIFLIIQSQSQWSGWSGRRRWSCLVWSLLER